MTKIYPVLLAGGTGTRLWPVSRKSYPKQFTNLKNHETLFQLSATRLSRSEKNIFHPLITITNQDFRFIAAEQLNGIGLDIGDIILEPEGKNTAAAILTSAIFVLNKDPDAIIVAAPSDHIIPDIALFQNMVNLGISSAKNGDVITFGIVPTKAETGYGYLEVNRVDTLKPQKVNSFVEKPSAQKAEKFLQSGKFLWNSGIFMFKASVMLNLFSEFFPDLVAPVKKAVEGGYHDLDFFRLDPKAWSLCHEISIDYAIMEHARNVVCFAYKGSWSDLGDWDAVWRTSKSDQTGVFCSDNAHSFDCKNTLLRSESKEMQIVGIGLENIFAIGMKDAVVVGKRDRAQEVSTVLKTLKKKNIKQSEYFPKEYRPWGWFEVVASQARFQVKRILVQPNASLSLQSHHHRSEHWIVVEGTARVTVNNKVQLVSEGESIYIPLGAKHRLENPGKVPMLLIEVQTGTYLGEDDIVRYEDKYNRINKEVN